MVWRSGLDRTLIRLGVHRPSRMGRNRKSSPKASTGAPRVNERALTFAIHVIRRFCENKSTGCFGAFKELVDAGDPKQDGVRPGALQC